ncbi:MAG: HD domain-containing phosphohydrolase [Candidatus Izemoplasmataceae bacterium]
MLMWRKSYESHPVFIIVSLAILLIIQLEFSILSGGAAILNPTLALSVAVGWIFGRKTYLSIVLTLFVGHFSMRFFIYGFSLSESLFIALFLSLLTFLQVTLAIKIASLVHLERLENTLKFKTILAFILSALLIALIGAYFGNITLILSGVVTCDFYRCFLVYLFGDFMALVIFVPSMILAYHHDPERFVIHDAHLFIKKLLFFSAFIIFTVILAFEVSVFDYERHKYLILLFYIPIGFLFNYRMLHYLSILFLLIINQLHIQYLAVETQLRLYVATIMFIAFASMITLAIKRFYDVRISQYQEIKEKNRLLDLLLDEVYKLLRLSNDIIDSRDRLEKDYLVRTFSIAYQLFKSIQAGFAYKVKDGVLEMVAHEIYEKSQLPYLYETQALVEKDLDNLHVYDHFKNHLKKIYGEGFDLLDEGLYPLNTRIIIALHYQKNESFIIVLDRFSDERLSKTQVERLSYFAKLLDGLYKRNYFILRNTNLKDEVVLSIIRTLELYDPYTKGHSEDVAALSLEIGKALNLEEKALNELYLAAILHDIGKVGVKADILNKPARLTKEEYEAVKRHVDYGADVLFQAASLKPISKIVKHHHEWYNGLGYPDGLSKDNIPLASRIISIADMVSTMATNRPYRVHQTKEAILIELKKYQGTQFDPKLVEIMINLIHDGLLKKHFSLTH